MAHPEISGIAQEIRYLKSGSGPPLLLIHGLLGGSFCWRFNVPVFAKQYTTFAVDLPGFGENDAPRHFDCSMQTQANRLSALLGELELESVDVVGASWGGAVAIFLAAINRKVRSLVLAAPVNPWSDAGAGRIRFLNSRMGGALLRLALPISRPLHLTALHRMYGDPARISPGTLDGYSSTVLRRSTAHNVLNTLRQWELDVNALPAAISHVKAPSLLIWGTRDGAVTLQSSNSLVQALPDCKLALIEGAGHLPFEETPDEFNRLVLNFLQRIPIASGREPA
ncbi:MAG TPA: alpha/beta hydrolase [Candidatus Angelobacter sp.]|jgi:pimeloyl-ACP methyl ester carboxylesterase